MLIETLYNENDEKRKVKRRLSEICSKVEILEGKLKKKRSPMYQQRVNYKSPDFK
jgi:tetrahydromethanopterin S-methyltransferase subunit G